MNKAILISLIFINITANAFVRQGQESRPVKQNIDYSACTWNVWVESKYSVRKIENLVRKYAVINDESVTEVGYTVIEALFKTEQYGSSAPGVAASVIAMLNKIQGVTAVCQVDHANPHPRLSGGN
jgi:hypothetical protein